MADLVTAADVATVPELASLVGRADLANLISAASEVIEASVGRALSSATVTELYNGDGTRRLWLRRLPVSSISDVKLNGTSVDSTSPGWVFEPATGALVLGRGTDDWRFAQIYPRGVQNISVTYTGGPTTVPERAKRATLALMKFVAEGTKRPGLYESESIGDYAYKLASMTPGTLPAVVATMLKGLRSDFVL